MDGPREGCQCLECKGLCGPPVVCGMVSTIWLWLALGEGHQPSIV